MSKQEKDITEKILEDHNDVFADILNNVLFDGQEIVRPEELESAAPVSQLKFSGELHEQERDTLKRWKNSAVILAAFGFENQSQPDDSMPLRLLAYDGAEYKFQVNRYLTEKSAGRPVSPFYPVITVVLYFGVDKWRGFTSLRDCFQDVPPALRPLIPDYPVRVVEVASLTPEQVKGFKSDFRYVADYLVQVRAGNGYVPPIGWIDHVDETFKLMGAITGDKALFLNAAKKFHEEGKGKASMSWLEEQIKKSYDARLEESEKRRREAEKNAEDIRREAEDSRREAEDSRRKLEETERELRELKLRFGLA